MSKKDLELGQLVAAVDDALSLVEDYGAVQTGTVTISDPLPTLLKLCQEFSAAASAQTQDPIRTIHHFACTGGTLISKCLALMPNTHFLSEIDPLSTVGINKVSPKFSPTDIIRQLRYSRQPVADTTIIAVFLSGLETVYGEATRFGERLLLRDHTHSHFCVGARIPERPTFREIVAQRFPTRSVITVRHPLDSYLSLLVQHWEHFLPAGLDEYSRRYLAFLDAYPDTAVFRYEDFISEPDTNLEAMCRALELQFVSGTPHLMGGIEITGNSGRTGSAIEARPRRAVPRQVKHQVSESISFKMLCERLGYPN